mmetsp:Transcript_133666/g.303135  ORF Transcript_133666/g.303135 Transcript_133666/m.303135 type:complete len:271 (-) Transcript_133666:8-820(-)
MLHCQDPPTPPRGVPASPMGPRPVPCLSLKVDLGSLADTRGVSRAKPQQAAQGHGVSWEDTRQVASRSEQYGDGPSAPEPEQDRDSRRQELAALVDELLARRRSLYVAEPGSGGQVADSQRVHAAQGGGEQRERCPALPLSSILEEGRGPARGIRSGSGNQLPGKAVASLTLPRGDKTGGRRRVSKENWSPNGGVELHKPALPPKILAPVPAPPSSQPLPSSQPVVRKESGGQVHSSFWRSWVAPLGIFRILAFVVLLLVELKTRWRRLM